MRCFKLILLSCCLGLYGASPSVQAEEKSLAITSWGGAYEAGQKAAYFDDFVKETGIKLNMHAYNGGWDALKKGKPAFDVLDMPVADARSSCAKGFLDSLPVRRLYEGAEEKFAKADFFSNSFFKCGVVHLAFSTVIAYDVQAFSGAKPSKISDFFNIKKFPGKRGLKKDPDAVLEWALLSYGVPRRQIYDLLSTERGLRLAFRQLDKIKDHIIWWEEGSTPAEMLRTGKAAMSSGYNGRFFHAQTEGAPITVIWDGQIVDFGAWVISSASKKKDLGLKFIRYAMDPARMAKLASYISYGPTRHSAWERVGLHYKTGLQMRDHMPTAPRHMKKAVIKDAKWYARTASLRRRRFDAWLGVRNR